MARKSIFLLSANQRRRNLTYRVNKWKDNANKHTHTEKQTKTLETYNIVQGVCLQVRRKNTWVEFRNKKPNRR